MIRPARRSQSAREVVRLTGDSDATARALGAAASEADIVLDYLWGKPAQQAIMALLTARSDRSRAMNWIQIGATAGPTIELPSVALRSANLRLQGNGQGAVSATAYLAELPSLIHEITAGTIAAKPNTSAPGGCGSDLDPARPAGRTHRARSVAADLWLVLSLAAIHCPAAWPGWPRRR